MRKPLGQKTKPRGLLHLIGSNPLSKGEIYILSAADLNSSSTVLSHILP